MGGRFVFGCVTPGAEGGRLPDILRLCGMPGLGDPATVCRRVMAGLCGSVALWLLFWLSCPLDEFSGFGIGAGPAGDGDGSFHGFCGPSFAFCSVVRRSCACCCWSLFRSF